MFLNKQVSENLARALLLPDSTGTFFPTRFRPAAIPPVPPNAGVVVPNRPEPLELAPKSPALAAGVEAPKAGVEVPNKPLHQSV